MLLARLHAQQQVAAENFSQQGAASPESARSRKIFCSGVRVIERWYPMNSAACEATSVNLTSVENDPADAALSSASAASAGKTTMSAVRGTVARWCDPIDINPSDPVATCSTGPIMERVVRLVLMQLHQHTTKP